MTPQLPHHHFPAAATGPVLAVIADTHLAETIHILATAARCPLRLSTNPNQSRTLASRLIPGQHRAIVLDATTAQHLATSSNTLGSNTFSHRDQPTTRAIIVTDQPPTRLLYQAAITLRVEHLSCIPDDNDTILRFFRSIIAPTRHGKILAIRGLVGGAGASALTAAIAQSCTALGEVVAVDADPDSPGLSAHTGLLAEPGPGWGTLTALLNETGYGTVKTTSDGDPTGRRAHAAAVDVPFCAQSLVQILPRVEQVAILGHRADDTTNSLAAEWLPDDVAVGALGERSVASPEPRTMSAADPHAAAAETTEEPPGQSAAEQVSAAGGVLPGVIAELADHSQWVVVDTGQPQVLAIANHIVDVVPNTWHAITQAQHRHQANPTAHALVIRIVPHGTVAPATVAAALGWSSPDDTHSTAGGLVPRQGGPAAGWHVWPHDRRLASPTAAGRPTAWTRKTTALADAVSADLAQGN